MRLFRILLLALIIYSCSHVNNTDKRLTIINTNSVLDSLKSWSDTNYIIEKISVFENGILQNQIQIDSSGNILHWYVIEDDKMKYQQKYYPNGQLFSTLNFNSEGNYHGAYEFYHANGQLKMRGSFDNGKDQTSMLEMFNEDGTKINRE